MKKIIDDRAIRVEHVGSDCGHGVIRLPRNNKRGHTEASIIWSWGLGWEHVSVCPFNGAMPTWDDMCFIKDIFWDADEWVVQFHPAKSEYVNNMPNCLHLWRPINAELPTPPKILTGV